MITELNQSKTPYCSQKLDDENIDSAFLKHFILKTAKHFTLKFSEQMYFALHSKNIFLFKMMCMKTKILERLYDLKTEFFYFKQN